MIKLTILFLLCYQTYAIRVENHDTEYHEHKENKDSGEDFVEHKENKDNVEDFVDKTVREFGRKGQNKTFFSAGDSYSNSAELFGEKDNSINGVTIFKAFNYTDSILKDLLFKPSSTAVIVHVGPTTSHTLPNANSTGFVLVTEPQVVKKVNVTTQKPKQAVSKQVIKYKPSASRITRTVKKRATPSRVRLNVPFLMRIITNASKASDHERMLRIVNTTLLRLNAAYVCQVLPYTAAKNKNKLRNQPSYTFRNKNTRDQLRRYDTTDDAKGLAPDDIVVFALIFYKFL